VVLRGDELGIRNGTTELFKITADEKDGPESP
jgi:hypothetical protein